MSTIESKDVLELTKSTQSNLTTKFGMITTFIAAVAATIGSFLGQIGAKYIESSKEISVKEQDFYATIVQGCLKPEDEASRINCLLLVSETKIIHRDDVRNAIIDYAKKAKLEAKGEKKPSDRTTVVPSLSNLSSKPRALILSGQNSKANESLINSIKNDLSENNYHILGITTGFIDDSRPKDPEIRYFNTEDTEMALNISEQIQKLHNLQIPAKRYSDSSARPGYVEVWLGK